MSDLAHHQTKVVQLIFLGMDKSDNIQIIIVLTLVLFSFCFLNIVNSHVFCFESGFQFLVYVHVFASLLKYISSTLKNNCLDNIIVSKYKVYM